MAEVLTDGTIERTTLAQYISELGDVFIDVFGSDIDLAPESPQGQWISGLSIPLVRLDEAIIALFNANSLSRSKGYQIDDLLTPFGIERMPPTYSRVVVTIEGSDGTIIPADSRFEGPNNSIWVLSERTVIPAAGMIDVELTASETGPIQAAIGEINSIIDIVAGITSVHNSVTAIAGMNLETASNLKLRHIRNLSRFGFGFAESLESILSTIEGVVESKVFTNNTGDYLYTDGLRIPPYSIQCVIYSKPTADRTRAEIDADLIEYLALNKPVCNTHGEITGVHSTNSETIAVAYSNAVLTPVTVALELSAQSQIQGSSINNIRQKIVNFLENQVRIGEKLNRVRLLSDVISDQDIDITDSTIRTKNAPIFDIDSRIINRIQGGNASAGVYGFTGNDSIKLRLGTAANEASVDRTQYQTARDMITSMETELQGIAPAGATVDFGFRAKPTRIYSNEFSAGGAEALRDDLIQIHSDGGEFSIAGLDIAYDIQAADNTYAAIATSLQTLLRAQLGGITDSPFRIQTAIGTNRDLVNVSFDDTLMRFIIEFPAIESGTVPGVNVFGYDHYGSKVPNIGDASLPSMPTGLVAGALKLSLEQGGYYDNGYLEWYFTTGNVATPEFLATSEADVLGAEGLGLTEATGRVQVPNINVFTKFYIEDLADITISLEV